MAENTVVPSAPTGANGTLVEVANKATIHFTRKLPREQYGSAEFGIFLPVEVPSKADYVGDDGIVDGAYFTDLDLALKEGASLAKTLVWSEVGIEWEAANGVLIEKLERAFPHSTEQPQPMRETRPSGDAPTGAADALHCPKCNGPMWDNRATKKNPKQPDHKCKDSNCDGVIWPPREPRR